MAGQGSSSRAILYALVANAGIAVAKGAAAFYTGSGSMLAEAIHSLADCTNQLLLFLGLARARRAPDAEHPLGYGKVIYFWSFVVAILLFSVGGLFSVYEGVHKLQHPEPLHQAWVALVVLAVSIVLESFSCYGAVREVNKLRGVRPFWRWVRNSRSAELVVVLGEDFAALAGLVLAFVFILLATVTGNAQFDAAGSIAIGVILLVVAVYLVIHVKSLLIGRSADPELEAMIEDRIASDPSIERVFNVLTLQFGPDVMLAAKVQVKADLSARDAVAAVNRLEKEIRAAYPSVRWSFMETDVIA